MKKYFRNVLHRYEYVVLRGAGALFGLIPGRLSLMLGRLCGGVTYLLFKKYRRRAIHNIARALDLDRSKARTLALRSFQHLGEVWAENVYLWHRFSRDSWRDYVVELVGLEHLEAARAPGNGVIFITGHVGNWEMGGLVCAYLCDGIVSIANLGRNPFISTLVTEFRSRAGQQIVSRKGGARRMMRRLRGGGAVGIVMDFDARRHGILVPFFGQPASTTPTPARLAISTGAPILAGAVYRIGPLRHRYILFPPVYVPQTGDREAVIRETTERLNRIIEDAIRAAPDQWPWFHPRWRTGLGARARRRG